MFYWAVVLSFFVSGGWLMINKDASAPYEIPYLSGASLEAISDGSLITTKIAPVEEWEDILIGKWSYSFVEPYGQLVYTMQGEVEFKEDGTFFKYITWRHFGSKYSFEKNDPKIVAGGSYSGTWEMDNEIWKEKRLKCKITKTHNDARGDLDVCGVFYKLNEAKIYGQFNDEENKSKVTHFNRDNIIIESKSFATGETNKYFFKRLKE